MRRWILLGVVALVGLGGGVWFSILREQWQREECLEAARARCTESCARALERQREQLGEQVAAMRPTDPVEAAAFDASLGAGFVLGSMVEARVGTCVSSCVARSRC
jgi:hypothetical protein